MEDRRKSPEEKHHHARRSPDDKHHHVRKSPDDKHHHVRKSPDDKHHHVRRSSEEKHHHARRSPDDKHHHVRRSSEDKHHHVRRSSEEKHHKRVHSHDKARTFSPSFDSVTTVYLQNITALPSVERKLLNMPKKAKQSKGQKVKQKPGKIVASRPRPKGKQKMAKAPGVTKRGKKGPKAKGKKKKHLQKLVATKNIYHQSLKLKEIEVIVKTPPEVPKEPAKDPDGGAADAAAKETKPKKPAPKAKGKPGKAKAEPAKAKPEPAKADSKPVKAKPEPAKDEPKPVKAEPKPVKAEPKPVKAEPKPKKKKEPEYKVEDLKVKPGAPVRKTQKKKPPPKAPKILHHHNLSDFDDDEDEVHLLLERALTDERHSESPVYHFKPHTYSDDESEMEIPPAVKPKAIPEAKLHPRHHRPLLHGRLPGQAGADAAKHPQRAKHHGHAAHGHAADSDDSTSDGLKDGKKRHHDRIQYSVSKRPRHDTDASEKSDKDARGTEKKHSSDKETHEAGKKHPHDKEASAKESLDDEGQKLVKKHGRYEESLEYDEEALEKASAELGRKHHFAPRKPRPEKEHEEVKKQPHHKETHAAGKKHHADKEHHLDDKKHPHDAAAHANGEKHHKDKEHPSVVTSPQAGKKHHPDKEAHAAGRKTHHDKVAHGPGEKHADTGVHLNGEQQRADADTDVDDEKRPADVVDEGKLPRDAKAVANGKKHPAGAKPSAEGKKHARDAKSAVDAKKQPRGKGVPVDDEAPLDDTAVAVEAEKEAIDSVAAADVKKKPLDTKDGKKRPLAAKGPADVKKQPSDVKAHGLDKKLLSDTIAPVDEAEGEPADDAPVAAGKKKTHGTKDLKKQPPGTKAHADGKKIPHKAVTAVDEAEELHDIEGQEDDKKHPPDAKGHKGGKKHHPDTKARGKIHTRDGKTHDESEEHSLEARSHEDDVEERSPEEKSRDVDEKERSLDARSRDEDKERPLDTKGPDDDDKERSLDTKGHDSKERSLDTKGHDSKERSLDAKGHDDDDEKQRSLEAKTRDDEGVSAVDDHVDGKKHGARARRAGRKHVFDAIASDDEDADRSESEAEGFGEVGKHVDHAEAIGDDDTEDLVDDDELPFDIEGSFDEMTHVDGVDAAEVSEVVASEYSGLPWSPEVSLQSPETLDKSSRGEEGEAIAVQEAAVMEGSTTVSVTQPESLELEPSTHLLEADTSQISEEKASSRVSSLEPPRSTPEQLPPSAAEVEKLPQPSVSTEELDLSQKEEDRYQYQLKIYRYLFSIGRALNIHIEHYFEELDEEAKARLRLAALDVHVDLAETLRVELLVVTEYIMTALLKPCLTFSPSGPKDTGKVVLSQCLTQFPTCVKICYKNFTSWKRWRRLQCSCCCRCDESSSDSPCTPHRPAALPHLPENTPHVGSEAGSPEQTEGPGDGPTSGENESNGVVSLESIEETIVGFAELYTRELDEETTATLKMALKLRKIDIVDILRHLIKRCAMDSLAKMSELYLSDSVVTETVVDDKAAAGPRSAESASGEGAHAGPADLEEMFKSSVDRYFQQLDDEQRADFSVSLFDSEVDLSEMIRQDLHRSSKSFVEALSNFNPLLVPSSPEEH